MLVEKNGESVCVESQKLYESQPSTSRKYPLSMETHWEEDISYPKRTAHKQGSTYEFCSCTSFGCDHLDT